MSNRKETRDYNYPKSERSLSQEERAEAAPRLLREFTETLLQDQGFRNAAASAFIQAEKDVSIVLGNNVWKIEVWHNRDEKTNGIKIEIGTKKNAANIEAGWISHGRSDIWRNWSNEEIMIHAPRESNNAYLSYRGHRVKPVERSPYKIKNTRGNTGDNTDAVLENIEAVLAYLKTVVSQPPLPADTA